MDIANALTQREIVSGAEGECYITLGSDRYLFASVTKLEAKAEKQKKEVKVLGRRTPVNKSSSLKLTGSCTMHYNQSVLRKFMLQYKNTGVDTYAEIQVTNEDPSTYLGRQTIVLIGVNFDEVILAKLDIESDDSLTEDMNFTFEDFEMPESFAEINSMKA